MQDLILVSIPVLTYNHKNFIKQNLDGILIQKTNFKYEIIIGEDCSTDGTRGIVLDYAKKYPDLIKVISSEENIGAIKNQIRTLNACKGKYFALCEGDDFWTDPLKLQKQFDFLETNPEYGMVHTDVNHYYEEEKRLEKDYNKTNGILFPSGYIFKEYLKGDLFIKTATVMVRRELFLSAFNPVLFEEKKWKLTDLPIWLEIAAKSKIKYFDETTATYRLDDGSASRSKDLAKHHKFHLSVFDIRYYFWEKYSKDENIREILDIAYYKMMIGDAYKLKNLKMIKETMEKMKVKEIRLTIKQRFKYILLLLTGLIKLK